MRRYQNKSPEVAEYELKECEWWLRHHKGNVQYFCIRIAELLEAMDTDNVEYVDFFKNHFKATLPTFAGSVGLDLQWDGDE